MRGAFQIWNLRFRISDGEEPLTLTLSPEYRGEGTMAVYFFVSKIRRYGTAVRPVLSLKLPKSGLLSQMV